jgi:hypothetical protein
MALDGSPDPSFHCSSSDIKNIRRRSADIKIQLNFKQFTPLIQISNMCVNKQESRSNDIENIK